MSIRLHTIVLAVAATLSPLASQAQGHDGFDVVGDTLVRAAQPDTHGKSRAEVLAELAAWKKHPVHADGWAELGGGNTVRYVGTAAPGRSRADVRAELDAWKRNPVSHDGYAEIGSGLRFVGYPASAIEARDDVRVAAGSGFTMGVEPTQPAARAAEPGPNDLPVHLRFGRH